MRFYNTQHPFYCGIDLHARMMYVCILDQSGEVLVHRNMKTDPEAFLRAIAPYRPDIVVAVECMFTWYWLADLYADEDIPLRLGSAAVGGARSAAGSPTPRVHPAPARGEKVRLFGLSVHAEVSRTLATVIRGRGEAR